MPESNEPKTSEVPSSSEGVASFNPAQMLDSILKEQARAGELAQKASIPVAGGHTTEHPETMKGEPATAGQAPLMTGQVTGAHNAKMQGIGNAMIGVMNAASSISTEISNKRKLEIASKTHQLLSAQQAYDQALQIAKADPTNKDAAATAASNKAIMNGLLGDDKFRKALQKGMSIDWTKPGDANSLEHEAVKQGKGMAQQHMDYAESFNKQTPQKLEADPKAVAAYQAAATQSKEHTDTVKMLIPMINSMMRMQSMDKATEERLTTAQLKAATTAAVEAARESNALKIAHEKIQASFGLEQNRYLHATSEILLRGRVAVDTATKVLSTKQSSPGEQLKAFESFSNASAKTTAELTKEISTLEGQKAKAEHAKADPSVIKSLTDNLNTVKGTLKQYQKTSEALKTVFRTSTGGGAPSSAPEASAGASSTINAMSLLGDEGEEDSYGGSTDF